MAEGKRKGKHTSDRVRTYNKDGVGSFPVKGVRLDKAGIVDHKVEGLSGCGQSIMVQSTISALPRLYLLNQVRRSYRASRGVVLFLLWLKCTTVFYRPLAF